MYFQPNKITLMNMPVESNVYSIIIEKILMKKKRDTFWIISIGSDKQKPLTLILTLV